MLTPEQLDDAGEAVAVAYRQIEAELLDYLTQAIIDSDMSPQRAKTALNLLSQSMPQKVKAIIDEHADEIDQAVQDEVEDLLAKSDRFDLARIAKDALGATVTASALTAQTLAVTTSIRDLLARDNLALSEAARSKFLQWTTWATTQVATGNMTADKAMKKAVRELARGGLSIPFVTYKNEETGDTTVTNHVDVAVQRHIRSLIAQGSANLTMQRIDELGCEFVEVSSHIGSRPSHAEWQGRCYHVGGPKTVDGVTYEDFYEGTGYKGIAGDYTDLGDQLLGVNCRHSFAPWVPGSPRAYSPDPKHPSGLSNGEVYQLTQKQRARERAIKQTKRELAAAQRVYDAEPTPENQADVSKLKIRLRTQQANMRKFIDEANAKGDPEHPVLTRQPRRERAGDMPKVATSSNARMVKEPDATSKGERSMRTKPVNFDYVDSSEYRAAFDFFDDDDVGDVACDTARQMLRHRSGTTMEDFAAISTGKKAVVTKNTTSNRHKGAVLTSGNIKAIENAGRGDLIALHNHPESMPPSSADFLLIKHRSFRYGIIACHDGKVIRYRISNPERFNELVESGSLGDIDSYLRRNLVYFDTANGRKALAIALERRYGVTYEELG